MSFLALAAVAYVPVIRGIRLILAQNRLPMAMLVAGLAMVLAGRL